MATSLSITSRFRSAVITLTVASASYDVWWMYMNKETRDLQAMNCLPTFFLYDCEAHFRTMIVGLYTLYDTCPGTITIKSLIHELDASQAKPIWKKYRAVHAAVKKVTFLRHNVIAHRNAEESYDQLFAKAEIKPDHLKNLISDSCALLGMVASALNLELPVLSPLVTEETRQLLQTFNPR